MNLPSSSVAVSSARVCYRHGTTEARQVCSTCHRAICDACLAMGPGYEVTCASCASASKRRGTLMAAGITVGVFVVLGGLAAALLSAPPPVTYGEHRLEIARVEALVAQGPCDGQNTLTLADLLNKERDYRRVIRVVDAFDEACKPVPRLWWESYGARKQVQDYAGAIHDATRLIDDNPDDGDFWFWRGQAKRKAGDLVGAEADLKKAAELAGKNAFWSIVELADVDEERGAKCDAMPWLVQAARAHKDLAEKQGLTRRIARLVREGCPDALAVAPSDGKTTGVGLCAALPKALDVDTADTFAFVIQSTWGVRTRGVAEGAPTQCRVEFAENEREKGSILAGTGMRSFTARLVCAGLAPVYKTQLAISPLKAQELMTAELVDVAITRWCGGA